MNKNIERIIGIGILIIACALLITVPFELASYYLFEFPVRPIIGAKHTAKYTIQEHTNTSYSMKKDRYTYEVFDNQGNSKGIYQFIDCKEAKKTRGFWKTALKGWDISKCEVVRLGE